MIVWPGNTLVSPSGSAGLWGIDLTICVIESAPFTMSVADAGRNKTKLIGYIPDLIDILETQMGFIPHVTLVAANQTYDGLVQSVAAGICD